MNKAAKKENKNNKNTIAPERKTLKINSQTRTLLNVEYYTEKNIFISLTGIVNKICYLI